MWSCALMTGAAGAGSLILEFAVLSRLTGDDRFEVSLVYARPDGRRLPTRRILQYGIADLIIIYSATLSVSLMAYGSHPA
jgi:hypothetical protein